LIVFAPLLGCERVSPPPPAADTDPTPVAAAGLHNAFRVSPRIYSGSSPDDDAAFAALADLGIKTIITVDGSRPDVEAAHRHGLRYVHLPFGYDGIPHERVVALAKAAATLPGPIYVHCHHGQLRGPAAVAAIQLCTDPAWDTARAAAWLKTAGTDPRYRGLIGLPQSLVRPTAEELARAPADFPEVVAIPDLARLMVDVDGHSDNLKLAKAAGWAVPKDHPDVDPPHEALQLVEAFREAARLDAVRKRGPEFGKLLADAEAAAGGLEAALRARPIDADRTAAAFARSAATCAACHDRFRDGPAGR
jgi:protein tyrosine phosphatase (PTP) superfamily phosphohydrolase (DUF442 family)